MHAPAIKLSIVSFNQKELIDDNCSKEKKSDSHDESKPLSTYSMQKKSPNTESDRNLIIRCQKGDKIAFQQLYQRYASDVYSMAMRLVHSEDIAEEVTQETFISIYKNIGRFQFQSAFTSWVYRIAIRRAADFFKKNKHLGKTVSLLNDDSDSNLIQLAETRPTPGEIAQENEKEKRIEQAIQKLKEKQRIIVLLRYMKHMQYEEIAKVLGCRVGTVKSRLNRAHKSLEEILLEMNDEFTDQYSK